MKLTITRDEWDKAGKKAQFCLGLLAIAWRWGSPAYTHAKYRKADGEPIGKWAEMSVSHRRLVTQRRVDLVRLGLKYPERLVAACERAGERGESIPATVAVEFDVELESLEAEREKAREAAEREDVMLSSPGI